MITNIGGGLTTDNYVNVYWDDLTNQVQVQKFDDAADTSGTVITSGPDIGARNVNHAIVDGLENQSDDFTFLKYKFCSGTTLVNFFAQSLYPYVSRASGPNNIQCVSGGAVCDLAFSDTYSSQLASDTVTPDGTASVTATSSNGIVKYSLNPNFDYNTQGQLNGEFAGLYPGVYIITAKDAAGCFDQITVVVGVVQSYGVRYRLEYTDINNNKSRIDIEERGYEGEIEEVESDGPDPFKLRYNGDGELDRFKSIIPSEARLTLSSVTNFKFRHINSQDDRKYRLKFYKFIGNLVPGFTPDTLDPLGSWVNTTDPTFIETPPFSISWPWNTGGSPSVDFGGPDSSYVQVNSQSDIYKTAYSFEYGKSYSFGYTFDGLVSPQGGSKLAATFKIKVLGTDDIALAEKLVAYDGVNAVSGTYDFIAPYGAVSIGVVVHLDSTTGTQRTYQITSFINLTESIIGGDPLFELRWQGFIISTNGQEPYIKYPYPVEIVATCGLSDLKLLDFLDANDRKFKDDIITLTAIQEVLKKTGLEINLQCAVNRYEVSMSNGVNDDPFSQCKFNPSTFYNDDKIASCYDVLDEVLRSFGARILQRNGKWFISCVEEHLSEMPYREFDAQGVFIGQGEVDDGVNFDSASAVNRAVFTEQDAMHESILAYGKMSFEHTLLKNASLVPSYGFEEDDVTTAPNGATVFKNWNVILSSSPGTTYGIKKTKSLQGDYTFYTKFIDGPGKYLQLISKSFPIEYSPDDVFEFSFDYSVLLLLYAGSASQNPYWVRLKWSLKIGDFFFREDIGWTSEPLEDRYNYVYVDAFNTSQNYKVRGLFRDVTSLVSNETAYIEFWIEGSEPFDFEASGSDFSELKDIDTVLRSPGFKVNGKYEVLAPTFNRYFYSLQSGTTAQSLPDIVRPNDFDSSSNAKYWKLEQVQTSYKLVEYVYIDNVVFLNYPNGAELPDNVTIEKPNNQNIKIEFEGKYLLNDIDIDTINNSERAYKNFYKLLDGTPTQTWERSYRPGVGKLLSLLASDFASQYKKPGSKLTGSFTSDVEVFPTSIMTEVNDNNRKYLFMGYELNDKMYSIVFDLSSLANVLDADGDDIDAGFTIGFSLGFRS